THKQVQLFTPCIIDPDKAIRCWNALYPSDLINPTNPAAMIAIMAQAYTKADDKNALRLLSGATYGSSFVGMVHVLNTTETTMRQSTSSSSSSGFSQVTGGGKKDPNASVDSAAAAAMSMQDTMSTAGALDYYTGGSSFSMQAGSAIAALKSLQNI